MNEGKRDVDLFREYLLPSLEKSLQLQVSKVKPRNQPRKNPQLATKLLRENKINKRAVGDDFTIKKDVEEKVETIIQTKWMRIQHPCDSE